MSEEMKVQEVSRVILIGGQLATASISEYKGKKYFSVRLMRDDDGELKFAKSGISIPVEGATDLLNAVIDLFRDGLGIAYSLVEEDRIEA
jgi:uncharacterized protein (DUF2141 family)